MFDLISLINTIHGTIDKPSPMPSKMNPMNKEVDEFAKASISHAIINGIAAKIKVTLRPKCSAM